MAMLAPDAILQIGMGFFGSKTLLSAVELGLFTHLEKGSQTGSELTTALGLHPRANPDFYDGLVALGLLERDGEGAGARYRNTAETAFFLDRAKPSYVGGSFCGWPVRSMMSLNMLIEIGEGFDFTGADFTRWCLEVGFKRTEIIPLAGPSSAAVAYK